MKVVGRTIVFIAIVCAAIGVMMLLRTERRVAAQQTAGATSKSDQGITGPYNVDPNWPKPMSGWSGHQGWTWGSVQGLFVENSNRIFVAMRGELPELAPRQDPVVVQLKTASGTAAVQLPNSRQNRSADSPGEAGPYPGRVEGKDYRWEHIIQVFDSQGNLKEETNSVWKQWDSLFKPADIPATGRGRVHKILISPYDPEKRIWAIDDGNQVIRIFSNDGKRLLQTIGTPQTTTERNCKATGNSNPPAPSLTKKCGPANQTFGRQTDIAWLPDGTFFVADGYEETRVVKFDKDGKFLMAWGERGEPGGREMRPNYFNTVHGIVIDKERRIYVDDRSNHRVQIFDENGKFLDQWFLGPYATIYHMYIEADQQHIWMSDTRALFQKYDLTGNMLSSWGAYGLRAGEMWGVHQFGVDENGNLYTSEVHSGKPQKFTPKPGADPAKLVGQPLRVAWK